MISATNDSAPDPERRDDSYWRRLLYRWFVEYNPLYVLSASLVLGGMILLSRGLAQTDSLRGELGVAAIAEIYALALIGGAALLTRIGQRRPAVMLALLAVLYQWDLMLHTETCTYLGAVGVFAAGTWMALFIAKLHALAWAMKIRLSRSASATATFGALGLALLPFVVPTLGPRGGSALVALWASGLVLLHRVREGKSLTSLVPLDAWGQTVLRRVVRAMSILSALLIVLHVLFWSTEHLIDLRTFLCIAPLLATRWIRSEARVWGVTVAMLVFVGLTLPTAFASTALVAAIALAARAVLAARSPEAAAERRQEAPGGPYRIVGGDPALASLPVEEVVDADTVVPGGRAAMLRLATGATFALYLSIWTSGWSQGPWPAHVLPLDVVLALLVSIVGVWRLRARLPLAPLAAAGVHLVVQARLVPAPRSLLEWGGALVGIGFVLLIASLATSYWLRSTSRGSSQT